MRRRARGTSSASAPARACYGRHLGSRATAQRQPPAPEAGEDDTHSADKATDVLAPGEVTGEVQAVQAPTDPTPAEPTQSHVSNSVKHLSNNAQRRATPLGMRTQKDAAIGLRVTKAERDAWEQAAEQDGRTLTSWIVRRCNGEPTTAPVLPPSTAAAAKPKRKVR